LVVIIIQKLSVNETKNKEIHLCLIRIDLWAIGCILYELLTLEPLFHCKQDDIKASSPFNRDALEKIFQVVGYPTGSHFFGYQKLNRKYFRLFTDSEWPGMKQMPEHQRLIKEGFRAIQ